MRNTSIVLGDHFVEYAAAQVASGRYASISEVVRDGLRLHEDRQKRIARVNDLLEEGENSGDPIEFDFDAYIAAIGNDDDREAA